MADRQGAASACQRPASLPSRCDTCRHWSPGPCAKPSLPTASNSPTPPSMCPPHPHPHTHAGNNHATQTQPTPPLPTQTCWPPRARHSRLHQPPLPAPPCQALKLHQPPCPRDADPPRLPARRRGAPPHALLVGAHLPPRGGQPPGLLPGPAPPPPDQHTGLRCLQAPLHLPLLCPPLRLLPRRGAQYSHEWLLPRGGGRLARDGAAQGVLAARGGGGFGGCGEAWGGCVVAHCPTRRLLLCCSLLVCGALGSGGTSSCGMWVRWPQGPIHRLCGRVQLASSSRPTCSTPPAPPGHHPAPAPVVCRRTL